ncbi:signal peptidase II [Microbulbifer thermotolerans]|uniref:Lipoprotein signal peptidase n=1 Tax=Microbulbifer thermotolerans TaxID=252514 RepID=A0A143HJF1_MICTH|nr:signal peptidase II [Microbulbifer thermotolerans]AMX01637.1 signal peptidase II [Microbulbifer thermotolerans]MCX2795931.1 signal peptidase II [Microbulbifer thermotolerans]WKT61129.1 signal peptidase II [Microbulbifer thermotolerans]
MLKTGLKAFSHPWRWYWLALGVILLDIATKVWAVEAFMYGPAMQIIPGLLQFTYAENYGAAFSFLADAGGWQRWFFGVIAFGFSIVVTVWLWRLSPAKRWEPAALGLILGGAIGNLWDRMLLGYVRDFISVYYGGWSFPVFNVADMAISIGAAMLVIELLFFAGKKGEAEKSAEV